MDTLVITALFFLALAILMMGVLEDLACMPFRHVSATRNKDNNIKKPKTKDL